MHLGVSYSLYRLPRSLKKLGEHVFYYDVKLIYPGSSEEFKELATIREESVYESHGYDRSPYYSGGSSRVTRYHCFDSSSNSIEVLCESDGVTLLYGKRHRSDNEDQRSRNKNERSSDNVRAEDKIFRRAYKSRAI